MHLPAAYSVDIATKCGCVRRRLLSSRRQSQLRRSVDQAGCSLNAGRPTNCYGLEASSIPTGKVDNKYGVQRKCKGVFSTKRDGTGQRIVLENQGNFGVAKVL